MQSCLSYDGSFDGLLTALAAALERPGACARITRDRKEDLLPLGPVEAVVSDPARAEAFLARIRAILSEEIGRKLYYVHCSETPGMENALLAYLGLAFERGADIGGWRAQPAVRRVEETARRVGYEIQRLKGLVRFRELADDRLWAPIEPDADILWPLSAHFRRRLGGERWLLHDARRGYAINHEAGKLFPLDGEELAALLRTRLSREEAEYSRLWQTYFRRIAIGARSNSRLQRQNMPRRYWKWLIEMQPEK
jgi:probable DNA metabolism protein